MAKTKAKANVKPVKAMKAMKAKTKANVKPVKAMKAMKAKNDADSKYLFRDTTNISFVWIEAWLEGAAEKYNNHIKIKVWK